MKKTWIALLAALCLLLSCTALAEEKITLADLSAEHVYEAKLTRVVKFMGEGLMDHYYVQQGAATDGEYAYCLLESRPDAACGMFKLSLEDWSIVEIVYNVPVEHGNGLTYNSRTNQFVVSHCKPSTNRISILDHDTYAVLDVFDLPMPVLSIAYDEVGDRYVVGHKDGVHFSVLDSEFNIVATHTMVPEYTNNQDCDCDENFIYLLEWDTDKLYSSNVSVYDWDGNFVTSIVLKSMNEVESMFHFDDRIIFPFYTKQADLYEATLKIK